MLLSTSGLEHQTVSCAGRKPAKSDEMRSSMATAADCIESSTCIIQPKVKKLDCTFENWL